MWLIDIRGAAQRARAVPERPGVPCGTGTSHRAITLVGDGENRMRWPQRRTSSGGGDLASGEFGKLGVLDPERGDQRIGTEGAVRDRRRALRCPATRPLG